MTWVRSANFSIVQNRPVAIAIRLNVCRGRHAGQFRIGISNGADLVVHPVTIRNESNVAEGRLLAQHWTA